MPARDEISKILMQPTLSSPHNYYNSLQSHLLCTMAALKEKLIAPVVKEVTVPDNKTAVVSVGQMGVVCAISIWETPWLVNLLLWIFWNIN